MYKSLDFIKKECVSIDVFFSECIIFVNSTKKCPNISNIMDFFMIGFKKEFQKRIENIDNNYEILSNYTKMAEDLYELKMLVKENNISKIKRHNLYFLYNTFVSIQSKFEPYEKRTNLYSSIKQRNLKKEIDKMNKLNSKLNSMNLKNKDLFLTNEELNWVKDFYHFIMIHHLPSIGQKSKQHDTILFNSGKRKVTPFLKTRFNSFPTLNNYLLDLESSLLEDVLFSEKDKDILIEHKEKHSKHKEFECIIENSKIEIKKKLEKKNMLKVRF